MALSLELEARQIIETIDRDGSQAANRLVRFANNFAYNEALRHSALTLRLGYSRADSATAQA